MKSYAKHIAVFLTSSVILAGALAACSHHRYHDPETRGEWLVEKVTDELELNKSQQSKLEIVRQEILAIRKEIKVDRESTREEILKILEQPQLDRQKTLSIVEQRTASINQYAPQIVNLLGDFYDSLSDIQRSKLKEHIADMGKHHHW